jgi:hypothetical protein
VSYSQRAFQMERTQRYGDAVSIELKFDIEIIDFLPSSEIAHEIDVMPMLLRGISDSVVIVGRSKVDEALTYFLEAIAEIRDVGLHSRITELNAPLGREFMDSLQGELRGVPILWWGGVHSLGNHYG